MPEVQRLKATQVRIAITDYNNSTLEVTITTPRLSIMSTNSAITSNWQESLHTLFTDPRAMQYFARGLPLTTQVITGIIKNWKDLWESKDPFSAFCIFLNTSHRLKNDQECIGYIALNHTNTTSNISIDLALLPQYWQQGFGAEAASAIINHYIPHLITNHPQLIKTALQAENPECTELFSIQVNIRRENIAAQKIATKIGFPETGEGSQTFFCGGIQVGHIIRESNQQKLAEKLQEEGEVPTSTICTIM